MQSRSVHAPKLDERLLAFELPPENIPTEVERALCLTVLWGRAVLDTAVIHEFRDVVLGGRADVARGGIDLECDGGFAATRFVIARTTAFGAQVIVPEGAQCGLRSKDGTVRYDVPLAVAEAPFAASSYDLTPGERLVYASGPLTVIAQYVRADAALGPGELSDYNFARMLSISALVHSYFVVAAHLTPTPNRGLVDEMRANRWAINQAKFAPEKEEPPKRLNLAGMREAAPAPEPEGKFGPPDESDREAAPSKRGAPRVDPNKRERDRQIAERAGLLGMLKSGEVAVASVFGPGGLGVGINDAMGGLRGPNAGDAGGAGGLGSRGPNGGGGDGSLSIGAIGRRPGRGGAGDGNIDLGGGGRRKIVLPPRGPSSVEGGLTKAEIARVIRRNLPRFKYCYEKQLNKNPNLAGKVAISFTIAPTGAVAKAQVFESSMNHGPVESCVQKVLLSLKFDRPRGGGIVVVRYPFVFSST